VNEKEKIMVLNLRETIKQNPILAILRNVPLEDVLPYAHALTEGGCHFFEVALNSPNALEEITLLRRSLGADALVGAGTVLTVEQAVSAREAGAGFLLSPSTHEDVLAWCRDEGMAILPGVLTPSDVGLCLRYGITAMKLFPAGSMPLRYVKDLKGPFDGTEYMAIGGVSADRLGDFFRAGYLGVGLGSGLCPSALVKAKDWDGCRRYVAGMMEQVRGIKEEL